MDFLWFSIVFGGYFGNEGLMMCGFNVFLDCYDVKAAYSDFSGRLKVFESEKMFLKMIVL